MSVDREQFKKLVVEPVVDELGLPSKESSVSILLAIAAHESLGARYLAQIRGPARGPYQFEKPTHDLVWRRLNNETSSKYVRSIVGWFDANYLNNREFDKVVTDFRYATAMARALLWFDPKPLPQPDDDAGIYSTYIRVWRPGKPPTEAQFIRANSTWT